MTDLSSPAKSSFSETQLLALAGGSSKELQKYTERHGSMPSGSVLDLFLRGLVTLPQVVGLLGLSGMGVAISVMITPQKLTPHISVSMGYQRQVNTQSDDPILCKCDGSLAGPACFQLDACGCLCLDIR